MDKVIYFQPPGIKPEFCEAGIIPEDDNEYVHYLGEPCKILVKDVKIIDSKDVFHDKKGRLICIKQQSNGN